MNSLVSLIALATSTPAAPQTVEDDTIVVTASGVEQPRDETGQAITVIDQQTIETRQAVDVTDLLVTTPGVRVGRNGGTGGATGISLRGAETTQTLVLIDGVKVNDPSGIGDGYDFGHLLTGNIRRIEVLHGSNSVVHGSQAIGGVVSLTTGLPTTGFEGEASAEYGYADTLTAKANVSGRAGIAAGSAGIAYVRTDGISAAQGGSERDGYKNLAANARLKLDFSDAVSLDLRGYYINADLDFDSFFGPPADSSDVSQIDQIAAYAGLNFAFGDLLSNRAAVTWLRNDRDYFFTRGTAPDYGYSGSNLRFEYQGVLTPVDQARLVFGYEHERPDYEFFGFGSTSQARANIDSVYALAIVQPVIGLTVTGGARHDDHSQFGGATTVGANFNYSPNGGATNLRGSYGEGFKAPSLYQLYDSFSGNVALRPERSQSYDLGIDQRLDGNGRAILALTAFHRDTTSQINYDYVTNRYGNLDRTRARGIEAALTLRPVEALTLTASYSHVDAHDRSPTSPHFGNRLPRRAADAVSVSIDHQWRFGLSTGATLTMVGDSFEDTANLTPLNAYAVAGIRASLPIGKAIEIYGRIDNLFDAQYATAFGYGSYGRSAYGGVRLRF